MSDLIERAKAALEEHEASWDENGKYLAGTETTALEEMAPDLARLAVAAGELAERLDAKLRLCCGGTDADRAALARFRAIAEGGE